MRRDGSAIRASRIGTDDHAPAGPMTRLRAGLVGLGTMGRQHARVLRDLAGVELVGAIDPDPRARGAARSISAAAGLDELLALGIDICVVAAPTMMHADIGLRLADAGVHTLIEKPLAPDPASARLLAKAFDDRRLVGCVGHIERYSPALRALRARLTQGELGPVFQIATRRQGPFPARIRDVGVVMDLATHDIDVTQWVTGSHYRTVSAFAGRPSGRPHEDLVAVSGVLFDGTVASHLVNWLSPMKERVIAVTGQRGCLVADTLATELWYHRNGSVTVADPHDPPFHSASEGDLIRYAVGKREALVTELENFRDAVLGKPADVVTMGQGVETIEVATAVLAASRDGSAVGLAASGMRLADVPGPALGSRAQVAM
jgi:UDP-N-acetylglucosamine 3-dehydrogenase